jgi:hypothetical protein
MTIQITALLSTSAPSVGLSGGSVIDEPANSADALPRRRLNRNSTCQA